MSISTIRKARLPGYLLRGRNMKVGPQCSYNPQRKALSLSQETILTPALIAALEEFLRRERRSTRTTTVPSIHTISPTE